MTNYGDVYTETDIILQSVGDDIEVIIGTIADDTFNNASTARTFEGGGGADLYLIGMANGGDTVRGFANGADQVRVGAGATAAVQMGANWTASAASHSFGNLTFDTAGFDLNAAGLGGSSGVTIRNLLTNNGSTMTGTAFADRFETAGTQDVIDGGEGNDTYVCLGGGIGLIFDSGTSLGDHLIVDASVWLGMTIEHVTLVGSAADRQWQRRRQPHDRQRSGQHLCRCGRGRHDAGRTWQRHLLLYRQRNPDRGGVSGALLRYRFRLDHRP